MRGLLTKTAALPAAVLVVLLLVTACSNPSGDDNNNGGGGLPTLPAYTLKSIPGGTVNVDTDYNGVSSGNGTGPFSNASGTNVPIAAFKIGETEVTYELWYAVKTWATDDARGGNKYTFANEGLEGNDGIVGALPTEAKLEPVTYINWRDAVVWCNAYSEASGKTPYYYLEGTSDFSDSTKVLRSSNEEGGVTAGSGKAEKATPNASADGFRLPTEAQWEYAARGGVPSGSAPWTNTYAGTNVEGSLGDYAWYTTNASGSTNPVKGKSPNSAGLYDMSGNVWEWCQDIYTGSNRVFRGGSWDNIASFCALSSRYNTYPDFRDISLGFRVACP
jgi:formylglycine-generating enzyme required for sulfatase activity